MRLIKSAICKVYWKKHSDIIRKFCSKNQFVPSYDKDIQGASEIPSAKGLPIVGTLFSLLNAGGSKNLHLYIDNRHKELGPIFKESIGPVDAVFVSDPQIMRKIYSKEGKYPVHILPEAWILYNEKYGSKRGLYFMNGEEWLHYRRILNKVLLTNYNNSDFEIVQNDVINQWINSWKLNINKDIDLVETQFYKLSLSYVMASLIGINYINCKDEFANSVESLSAYIHSIFEESCKLNLVPAKLAAFLNLSPWKRFVIAVNSAIDEGDGMVKKMIKMSSDDGLLKKLVNENVPEDVLKRIIIDLILAAGDTTAFTIQWSIYLLSRHKDVQELLRKNSTDQVLLRGIVKETLRLYPAAPFITRKLPSDIVLNGYRIASGEMLIMSLYSSGRDEGYFPKPNEFWPQRWERKEVRFDKDGVKNSNIAEHRGVIEPIASQPFAMGLRSCIGKKLAESQMMLTLTKIVENFRLESLGETKMVLHFVPVPNTPIRIHLSSIKG